jgi:type II secretory pathway predicted ATPase ExeA
VLVRLNQCLFERHGANETAVLIVDEAQNLALDVLEEIRLLANLETSTEKLLQIVLSGHPEFQEKLKHPQLRQLRQRIMLQCKTHPLTLEQTQGYIAERLRIAGCKGVPIFTPEAIEAAHRYSRGIPRVTNLLCEHALITAMAEGEKPVSGHIVEDVAREFELDRAEPAAAANENTANL